MQEFFFFFLKTLIFCLILKWHVLLNKGVLLFVEKEKKSQSEPNVKLQTFLGPPPIYPAYKSFPGLAQVIELLEGFCFVDFKHLV